jgi:uncharacterized damage-inducible protein DinB
MDGLRYALLHNAWATRRLIDACRDLTPEQLGTTTTGAVGSLRETIAHVVGAEGQRLRKLLTGSAASWSWTRADTPDLDQLAASAEDNERFWTGYVASPHDPEATVRVDWAGGWYDVAAGVVLAQVIHHGNSHREQACAILTALGVEVPDLSGWGYGGATGRVVRVE